MKKNKVVYYHRRKDTGEVFYVGIGNNKRPYSKSNRNNYWNNIVNKVGYDVDIIHTGLTWDESSALEIQYIKEFGRKDLGLGNLVNMTNGGDGVLGRVWTKEQLIKKGKKVAGSKNGMYNYKFTKEQLHQLSKKAIGENNFNSKLTKEDVIWIRNNAVKGINQFNKGNYLEISKKYGIDRRMVGLIVNRKNWKHI